MTTGWAGEMTAPWLRLLGEVQTDPTGGLWAVYTGHVLWRWPNQLALYLLWG